ncbi:MAG: RES family NAD+ phosphorylase [Legionella sp.]|nr:RES family NAD+ phosphorylase [Legionella sp.]
MVNQVHRLVPSKFPPVLLFDWAESPEELEAIAALEGLTNPRLKTELGEIHVVPKSEWVSGAGATPIMAAFTHIGHPSRFTDGSFGVFYAADSIHTAIKETIFHRERFYRASNEPACSISMREYIAQITQPLIQLDQTTHQYYLDPDINSYKKSRKFGLEQREKKVWGLSYPSTRHSGGTCVAILRPKAIAVPVKQGTHYRYIWDGQSITGAYKINKVNLHID